MKLFWLMGTALLDSCFFLILSNAIFPIKHKAFAYGFLVPIGIGMSLFYPFPSPSVQIFLFLCMLFFVEFIYDGSLQEKLFPCFAIYLLHFLSCLLVLFCFALVDTRYVSAIFHHPLVYLIFYFFSTLLFLCCTMLVFPRLRKHTMMPFSVIFISICFFLGLLSCDYYFLMQSISPFLALLITSLWTLFYLLLLAFQCNRPSKSGAYVDKDVLHKWKEQVLAIQAYVNETGNDPKLLALLQDLPYPNHMEFHTGHPQLDTYLKQWSASYQSNDIELHIFIGDDLMFLQEETLEKVLNACFSMMLKQRFTGRKKEVCFSILQERYGVKLLFQAYDSEIQANTIELELNEQLQPLLGLATYQYENGISTILVYFPYPIESGRKEIEDDLS